MENQPLISFISPNYNRAEFIADTLDSLLAQSDPRWENIIVDDGSTDHSVEIITSYCRRDPRFRFYRRERQPKGACTCRNIGVAQSRGRYVVFLDTDDLAEPFCVEQRLSTMEANRDLDFGIFPMQKFVHEPGDMQVWWNIDKPNEDDLLRMFKQDGVCQGTGPAFSKEAFLQVGGWGESLKVWQDVDLFFRLYIQGYRYKKFFDLRPDVQIREYSGSISRSDFFSSQKMESRFRVLQQAVDLLHEQGLVDLVSHAKYMTAELVIGSIRSNQYNLAKQILGWATRKSVFASSEAHVLKRYYWVRKLRMSKFSSIEEGLQQELDILRCVESTIGKIPISEPSVAYV